MAMECLTPWSSRKLSRGRVAEVDALGYLGLQKPGRVLQAPQAQLLAGIVAHHRNVDFGVAEVGGDFHKGHRHVADPRDRSARSEWPC